MPLTTKETSFLSRAEGKRGARGGPSAVWVTFRAPAPLAGHRIGREGW